MDNLIEKQRIISIQNILKFTFVILPIAAGIDKFTNILTNWEMYLSPVLLKMLPFSAHTFMMLVGVIEIAAGIIVFVRPRLGSYVVTAWLVCIALNLLVSGHYLDVAVRDLAMAMGAYTLARLSVLTENRGEARDIKGSLAGQKI